MNAHMNTHMDTRSKHVVRHGGRCLYLLSQLANLRYMLLKNNPDSSKQVKSQDIVGTWVPTGGG